MQRPVPQIRIQPPSMVVLKNTMQNATYVKHIQLKKEK
jgi:hypothetical protein